ncbi:MAG: pilus assembly protein N-terminal domain-containing protein, partial [Myxococcota bacterium]
SLASEHGRRFVIVNGLAPGRATMLVWPEDGERFPVAVEVRGQAGAPAPATASDAAHQERVSLTVGEEIELIVPGTQRVAVGDPEIADIRVENAAPRLRIRGVTSGVTTMLVWGQDGERRSFQLEVTED